MQLFPGSSVQHLEFWQSDHRPLLIHICDRLVQNFGNPSQSRRFHFEEWWASDPDCEDIVKRLWGGSGAGDEVSLLLFEAASL
ncbi:hypothetical protein ACOSP7_007521 [Xanthoceras sorbifolium]